MKEESHTTNLTCRDRYCTYREEKGGNSNAFSVVLKLKELFSTQGHAAGAGVVCVCPQLCQVWVRVPWVRTPTLG